MNTKKRSRTSNSSVSVDIISPLPTPETITPQPGLFLSSNSPFSIYVTLICVLFIRLLLLFPRYIPAFHAPHDDELFIRLANSIIHGQWLGSYNQFTLAKPAIYQVLLALNHFIGFPLLVTQEFLYQSSIALVALVLLRVGLRTAAFACVLLLGFDPRSLDVEMARVGPHTIIPTLLLLFFAYALLYLTRSHSSVPLAILTSVVFGTFFMMRWESIWIVPSLLAVGVIGVWCGHWSWRRVSLLTSVLLIMVLMFDTTIRLLNYNYYGVFVTTDFQDTKFPIAYSQMQSIVGPVGRVRHLPMPRSQRLQAYEVSASFRQLQPALEQPGFYGFGCDFWPETCGDIGSGWFLWAVRDAAAAAGHYRTADTAELFYESITNELSQACAAKTLICKDRSLFNIKIPQTYSEYAIIFRNVLQSLEMFFYVELISGQPPRTDEIGLSSKDVSAALSDPGASNVRFHFETRTDDNCYLQLINSTEILWSKICKSLSVGLYHSELSSIIQIDSINLSPIIFSTSDKLRIRLFSFVTRNALDRRFDDGYTRSIELSGWAYDKFHRNTYPRLVSSVGGDVNPHYEDFVLLQDNITIQNIRILFHSYSAYFYKYLIPFFIFVGSVSLVLMYVISKQIYLYHVIYLFCFFVVMSRVMLLSIVSNDIPVVNFSQYLQCSSYILIASSIGLECCLRMLRVFYSSWFLKYLK